MRCVQRRRATSLPVGTAGTGEGALGWVVGAGSAGTGVRVRVRAVAGSATSCNRAKFAGLATLSVGVVQQLCARGTLLQMAGCQLSSH